MRIGEGGGERWGEVGKVGVREGRREWGGGRRGRKKKRKRRR
jgi:hypothetical protein